MKNTLFLLSIVSLLFSCVDLPPREKNLKDNLNKSLNLEQFETVQKVNNLLSLAELKQNHEYLSVVYLQNSCNPCYPKFIKWQQKMDSINTPDNHTVLFVIKGNSYEKFMKNVLEIEYVDDEYYTIMDPDGQFLEANKEIPRWKAGSFLSKDSENENGCTSPLPLTWKI